jgi:hypothetical protein
MPLSTDVNNVLTWTDHDVAAVPKMATMAAKLPCLAAW